MQLQDLVEKYKLLPHPEGGYYREVYRSPDSIPNLEGFEGERNFLTSIYFVLTSENFSAFHRIKQDELWNYHAGSNLYVHCIYPDGKYDRVEIGLDGDAVPQFVVPKGIWFASSVKDENAFSFVGCAVAPGFDFRDFELADRDELVKEYPDQEEVIRRFTRVI